MHVDDLADAAVFALRNIDAEHIYGLNISHLNVGTGEDISIADLAKQVASTVGYKGEIKHQLDKPDGTLRKLLDVSRLHNFGWKHKINLENGLSDTYGWDREQDAANLRL